MARRHHLGRDDGEQTNDDPADGGPQRRRQLGSVYNAFEPMDAAHQHDAEHGHHDAKHRGEQEILIGDGGHLRCDDAEMDGGETTGNEIADERSDPDRREARHRIVSDHEFEAVEGAGERRAECAGNASGGAAADQNAQVRAPQPEGAADPRCDAARELSVARLRSDRGPDAARPYRLQSDDHTSGKRHPAAMERVGLDGVDLAGRPPCRDEGVGDAQHQTAQRRHQHGQHRVEARQRRQALAQRQPEKQAVQDVDAAAHQRHHDAGERPHHRRKQDEAEFPGADEGAQPVRYFELGQRLAQAAPRFRALNDRTVPCHCPA